MRMNILSSCRRRIIGSIISLPITFIRNRHSLLSMSAFHNNNNNNNNNNSNNDVLVACNVYVTAGGEQYHRSILKRLLQLVQSMVCSDSSSSMYDPRSTTTSTAININERDYAVVVHAYVDPIYNRSSFHLAGTPMKVADTASYLASKAIDVLHSQQQEQEQDDEVVNVTKQQSTTIHPTIGLVDHISVMPLLPRIVDSSQQSFLDVNNDERYNIASGNAARIIGQRLASNHPTLKIFYYGDAHPDRIPLAIVRRERTTFFQSGGCISFASSAPTEHSKQQTNNIVGACTIGAPPYFVENYNIRLIGYDGTTARKLTRYIRTKWPGIVEGLTLPYNIQKYNQFDNSTSYGKDDVDGGQKSWEVACNLLRPDLISYLDVQACFDEWYSSLVDINLHRGDTREPFGYRVGTTAQQCHEALSTCSNSIQDRQQYDEMICKRFDSYF